MKKKKRLPKDVIVIEVSCKGSFAKRIAREEAIGKELGLIKLGTVEAQKDIVRPVFAYNLRKHDLKIVTLTPLVLIRRWFYSYKPKVERSKIGVGNLTKQELRRAIDVMLAVLGKRNDVNEDVRDVLQLQAVNLRAEIFDRYVQMKRQPVMSWSSLRSCSVHAVREAAQALGYSISSAKETENV